MKWIHYNIKIIVQYIENQAIGPKVTVDRVAGKNLSFNVNSVVEEFGELVGSLLMVRSIQIIRFSTPTLLVYLSS